ncbi:MAG: glycoside hydrolase family 3 protein, partial [Chloroflexota bacterium]
MKTLNLKSVPFNLSDDDICWVKQTLAAMGLRAKVGQLFCLLVAQEDVTDLLRQLETLDLKPGGFMCRPLPGAVVQKIHRQLQNR